MDVLRRAVEDSPATVIITDAKGRIVYVNRKFVQLTGYSRAEALGKNPRILQSGRHPRPFYARMWRTLARGEGWRGEFCNRKKNGRLYWESALIMALRDENGRTAHYLAIKEDITPVKRAEEKLKLYQARLEKIAEQRSESLKRIANRYRGSLKKLREAEFRYRTVADFTLDWEYWRAPDGSFLYLSPSVERITGHDADCFLKDPKLIERIIHPEDLSSWLEHHERAMEGKVEPGLIFRIRRRDGQILWIEHICRAVSGPKGEFLGIRASNRDITDRRNAEAQAHAHREELHRVGRQVTLGELTAALAHQLNQPLTAIVSNAQAGRALIRTGKAGQDEAMDILGEIASEGERAGAIVSRIRGLLNKRPAEVETLDLNQTVRDVIALLESDALIRKVRLEADLLPSIPPVVADRVQVQQVLLNLMHNAMEAMADTPRSPRQIVVRTHVLEDRSVRVEVQDTGCGFIEGETEKVFEPFHTTKAGGLGIGLSINRRIVESYGGRIWARNDPGGGATVSFVLPLAKQASK